MIKKYFLSILSRVFNIYPSQWSRVGECWAITLFFKLGSAIGWIVLTAAFVARYGIAYLPLLFVINAVLIMFSTYFFEQYITRIKREVYMILMILIAAICLFFASFVYEEFPQVFFALVIFAESVFLAQFNVFIPILVGDRFTPLESQKTFSFIESGETIGGIIGGSIVGLFASRFNPAWFLYIWIACLACVIFVFIITSFVRRGLPALHLDINSNTAASAAPRDEIKLVLTNISKMPFLKSLIFIVMFQWIFMNILEFQFTKSVEQGVTHKQEETIAKIEQNSGAMAAVLSADKNTAVNTLPVAEKPFEPALTGIEQQELTKKLGALKGVFHTLALIVQMLIASRIIAALGIVGGMIIHPVIMLMSLVGMFLKFGFMSSVITRASFEVSNIVHKNAYFASHYAFPKFIRDQAAEFLEGVVRPLGAVIGMAVIIGLQIFLAGKELSMWIHAIMFSIMVVVLFMTIRLQRKYTDITKDQLFHDGLPYPEKLGAIEILAQRGHKNAPEILVKKLRGLLDSGESAEPSSVKIKLLNALGELKDFNTLPEIVDALYDKDAHVRLEAASALMNFRDIGEKFYSQAFSRYRVIESLKEVFKNEKSSAVRSAIIRVFSLLRQPDIVPFLLNVLHDADIKTRADCIYTLGLFKDPNAAFYVTPYLEDAYPSVRANAIVALWQFPKYRDSLEIKLRFLTDSTDIETLKAGIYCLGEIGEHFEQPLHEFMSSAQDDARLEAAFALTKLGSELGFEHVLDHMLSLNPEEFENMSRFFHRLKPSVRDQLERYLIASVSRELNSIDNTDFASLERLRRLYILLDQHEELFTIERALHVRAAPQHDII